MEKRRIDSQRSPADHLQVDRDVDVKASYEASLALLDKNADDYDEQVAHLEEVLAAGPVRFDH